MISKITTSNLAVFEKDEDLLSSPYSNRASTATSLDGETQTPKASSEHKTTKSHKFTARSSTYWRALAGLIGIIIMFCGRFNLPNNQVKGIEDKVLIAFQGWNTWIHDNNNALWRDLMLFLCSSNLDILFFTTFFFWVKKGKTGRLPITIGLFYLIRGIVQSFFWCPTPAGYYWDCPGLPSFVAPYGEGTDFFFSGHSGFLVLLSNEWNEWGSKKMRNYILGSLVYTVFVLMVYQAHYSIDIFAGVFFADYVFRRVNDQKESIDNFFKNFAANMEKKFNKSNLEVKKND